jgi:hypothetical protein
VSSVQVDTVNPALNGLADASVTAVSDRAALSTA